MIAAQDDPTSMQIMENTLFCIVWISFLFYEIIEY